MSISPNPSRADGKAFHASVVYARRSLGRGNGSSHDLNRGCGIVRGFSCLRPTSITFAPCSANRSAIRRLIPLEPPVTKATCPQADWVER